MFSRPAVAVSCQQSVAVQNAGDNVVLGDLREMPDGLDDVGRCAVALIFPPPRQAQLGIGAATQWISRTISADASSRSATTLQITVRTTRFFRRRRCRCAQTVFRSCASFCEAQRINIALGCRRVMGRDPVFVPADLVQCPVPPTFEFRRDKAVPGIGSIVLARGPIRGGSAPRRDRGALRHTPRRAGGVHPARP